MGKMELGFLVSLIILLLHMELGICDLSRNSSLMCMERERRALLSFRATLSDTSNRLSSWNSNNKDCCSWEAVTCHRFTGHVIILDLTLGNTHRILEAKRVDSSLLELKHLTYLDLSSVNFNYIKFPAYLGSLKQLHYLNLSYTDFSGAVPHHLGNLTSLRTLDLSWGLYDDLKVDDLMWVTRLPLLEHFEMSGVDLSKTTHVFEVLYTLPSLLFLSLSNSGLDNTHLPVNKSTLLANVQHLDLSLNFFDGEFPCFLLNMTSLTFLDLSINNFKYSGTDGPLLKLTNLVHLNLAYTFLDDKVDWITEFLGNRCYLKSLDLTGTGIYGDISGVFLQNLSTHNLESLSLGDNIFYGEFHLHTSIGKLLSLTHLDISSNNLSGHFPSWLPNLTSLRSLILSRNQLAGEIPVSLGQLSNLEAIDISFNRFETTLSEAHFAKLSKLEKLQAGSNNMIRFVVGSDWVPHFQLNYLSLQSSRMLGQFPQWLQTQKALQWLYLSNCSITGTFPAWIYSMSSLRSLVLSHNSISGPMPEFSSSSLWLLDLSNNMITHLPNSIGYMIPHLKFLILARNLINNSIPDSICRIKNLTILDLSKNRFSGNLPNCWSSIESLTVASFSSNELTGVIPYSIGEARSLMRLRLDGNRLTGQLPSTLINCKRLDLLDVGGNNLSGKLPQWIGEHLLSLEFLRLRNNDFFGIIPHDLCRLSKLQVIDFANNNLTGNIPHCIGKLSGMMINHEHNDISFSYTVGSMFSEGLSQVIKGMELEYTTNFLFVVNLDLSDNHLVGEIPWELTDLPGLLGLNLSHNQLKGHIPAKIGDMKSLESLISPTTICRESFLTVYPV